MPVKVKRLFAVMVAACACSAVVQAQTSKPTPLVVDVQKVKGNVSPMLYGLMTEEINYSYDGGLYAELVSNRTFQDSKRGIPHWSLVELGAASAKMELDKTTGPSQAIPLSLKLKLDSSSPAGTGAGVANDGYWGIAVRPNTTYRGSVYAKMDGSSLVPVTIKLVNDVSGTVLASATIQPTADWKQHSFVLKTGVIPASSYNHLILSVGKPTTVWLSLVSLFPPTYNNRVNGNRADIMQKMAAMKPRFLRFPGGNYLEGDHISERFEWKKTIGPLVDRPTHRSPWNYISSDGMGLLEFLGWCEDLKMEPVLAVYAGYSLKQEVVKPGPDLEPYIADALDEIEYVTGGPDTKWGAQRAKDGHPAPFKLQYVEIGNEDWFDHSKSYEDRYAQFYKAIKARYPQLQLIATMPLKNMQPDVQDDHYYRNRHEFFADVAHYDKTDRQGPKIFVGEWATREGTPTTNFGAALGDAAWMTGMERNSDIVVMASYAPLFVNVNPHGMQWDSNLIGYDAMGSYGSPSYYAQVLFNEYLGNRILDASTPAENHELFSSVTRDSKSGSVYIKLVNASSLPQQVAIEVKGMRVAKGELATLAAKSVWATNTIDKPLQIVPVKSAMKGVSSSFVHTMPPLSIQVMQLDGK